MRPRLPLALLLAVAIAITLVACSRGADPTTSRQALNGPPHPPSSGVPAASAAPTGGPTVVAELNGTSILASELDAKVSSQLARLRQEEYEIREQALDALIADRLIGAEAARRHVSRDELVRVEVEARAKVSDAEVEDLYQQHKARFGREPRDAAVARIRQLLLARAVAERRQAYLQELRAKARVVVRLEIPRVQVEVPPDAPTTGPASAAVTLVEFTDYQCPFCHQAQVIVDQLLARYRNKLRLVHLAFPLDGHPGAAPAAKAARCAGEQGRFLEYHRSLMTARGILDQADLEARAAKLGLKASEFSTCLASSRHEAAIRASFEQGVALGVTGTPAYFVNGRLLSGARPYQEFAELIDAELAAR